MTVEHKAEILLDVSPDLSAEWLQVTVAPEESRTKVFKSGTWKAESEERPRGGQEEPNSTLGDNEQ